MKIEETEERLRQNDMNVSIIRQPQIKTEGIATLQFWTHFNFYIRISQTNIIALVGSSSLKRVSPVIQMQHRPSKVMHYEPDDNAEAIGGIHSSGRLSSNNELISPGSKNSQASDDRNHHVRHKHEDGK